MIHATRSIAPEQRRHWLGRSSASFLDDAVARAPDRPAVIEGGTVLTYRQLHDAAQGLAAGLQERGVGPGDVVVMQLPNWWEAAVVYQALMRLGAVCCPVVPIYRTRELRFILAQARPRAVVTAHRFRGFDHAAMFGELTDGPTLNIVVRPDGPPPRDVVPLQDLVLPGSQVPDTAVPDDVCMLMYTSGTTADPKGVIHNHQTLVYENQTIVELAELDEHDTVFMPSPVTHITGFLYGLLLPSMLATTAVFIDVWEPRRAVDLVEDHNARFTVGATPFLQGMVNVYEGLDTPSSLRLFLCGGADVPPELIRGASGTMGTTVARVYGSTEFPTYCSGGPDDPIGVRADTDGVPIAEAKGRISDGVDGVGELEVSGPELFLGYLDESLNTEAFTQDGWFRTGDLASIDGGGAVTIRGRRKDIIVRGGENISAKEVEDLLFEHPDIEDVAVVAMPDPVMVERACAFLVSRGGRQLGVEDLARFLDGYDLARQKYPERVELVESLPRTASGKVQKFLLRERVRTALGSD